VAADVDDARLVLSALWVSLMLTYLLGDVMRIFAGDFTPGRIDGEEASAWMWVLAALVMLIPIAMVVLSLTVPLPAARWMQLVAAGFLILFNIAGLPYPGAYDNMLIGVSFIINGATIWYAWTWG
jgi:hypothetical protein